MVNIGIIGSANAGKTSLLRLFVRYIEEGHVQEIDPNSRLVIIKTDFSGEVMTNQGESSETQTIHPNRVVFRETNGNRTHTLFAPGGDRSRAITRMGIITVSRIARRIILLFDLTRDLESQLLFFKDVRFLIGTISVCLNKVDMLDPSTSQAQIAEYQARIADYFQVRHLIVNRFYLTCSEGGEANRAFNDALIQMILNNIVGAPGDPEPIELQPKVDLPEEDRAYYRTTWGFDPVTEFRRVGKTQMWGWEVGFPLEQDLGLNAAGVKVYAQVIFTEIDKVKNLIVFRAGDREAAVTCTHTVLYEGNLETATKMNTNLPENIRPIRPAILPPWEHFVALKSYVDALAQVGFTNIFASVHKRDEDNPTTELPVGFNSDMQVQVIKCLSVVAPDATRALQRDWLIGIIEESPLDWLTKREPILRSIMPLDQILKDLQKFAPEWVQEHQLKLSALTLRLNTNG